MKEESKRRRYRGGGKEGIKRGKIQEWEMEKEKIGKDGSRKGKKKGTGKKGKRQSRKGWKDNMHAWRKNPRKEGTN